MKFLGSVINCGKIEADPEKIRAVAEWPVPVSLKKLQRFLGFHTFLPEVHQELQQPGPPPN